MDNQTPPQPTPQNPNEVNFNNAPSAPPPIQPRSNKWKIVIGVMVVIVLGLFGWYYFLVTKQVNTPVQIPTSKSQTNQLKPVSLELSMVTVPDAQNAFFDLNSIQFAGLNASTSDIANEPNLNAEMAMIRGQSYDAQMAEQLVTGSQVGLTKFSNAAAKNYFQVPDYADPSKLVLNLKLYPMNSWRAANRIYLLQAILLAHQDKPDEALKMAADSVKLGHNIQQSQGGIILYLVGMAIKDQSLQAMQTIMPLVQSSATLKQYSSMLDSYQDNKAGLANVFKFDYQHGILGLDVTEKNPKQDIASIINDPSTGFSAADKELLGYMLSNPNVFNKSETKQYIADYDTMLIQAIDQPCSNLQEVKAPDLLPSNKEDYKTTGNILGRWLVSQLQVSFSSLFQKRCQENVIFNQTKIIFALHGYKADHSGSLPSSLQDLVPTYLTALPTDPFSDQNFIYNPDKKEIYSVGLDHKDDGGELNTDWNKAKDYVAIIQ